MLPALARARLTKLSLATTPPPVRPYRDAALSHLRTLLAIDEFMTNAEKSAIRVDGWTVCSIVFDLTSVRDLSLAEIANQLGVSAATMSRATARFREMAGLDAAGSVRAIRTRA